jgi:hypothetical protein
VLLPGSHPPAAAPPLPAQPTILETRYLPPIPSSERIVVGVDAAGRAVSVDVLQRLVMVRAGDYTFAVPGPVTDVQRAPESQSDPGLRRDAVHWAGFSPGGRVLAARITLAPGRAAGLLPVQVSLERVGGELRLLVRNTTAVRVPAFTADAEPASVATALDETRAAARGDMLLTDAYAEVRTGLTPTAVEAVAPLRVTGRLGAREFSALLGDGRPLELRIAVQAEARRPQFRMRVEPVPPLELLTPPGATTWARTVRLGRLNGRQLLARAIGARLATARARQFDQFLAVPDTNATAKAVFVYRAVKARESTPVTPSNGNDGSNVLVTVLTLVAAGLALVGGVVWWAHS